MDPIGIIITIVVYSSLFYMGSKKGGIIDESRLTFAKHDLRRAVQALEFHKLLNGSYPDSLDALRTKDPFTTFTDPFQENMMKHKVLQYAKRGGKYVLFSVGPDRTPKTKDDIWPEFTPDELSKIGLTLEK